MDKVKKVFRKPNLACSGSLKYKGIKPPKCNGGRPCQACQETYETAQSGPNAVVIQHGYIFLARGNKVFLYETGPGIDKLTCVTDFPYLGTVTELRAEASGVFVLAGSAAYIIHGGPDPARMYTTGITTHIRSLKQINSSGFVIHNPEEEQ